MLKFNQSLIHLKNPLHKTTSCCIPKPSHPSTFSKPYLRSYTGTAPSVDVIQIDYDLRHRGSSSSLWSVCDGAVRFEYGSNLRSKLRRWRTTNSNEVGIGSFGSECAPAVGMSMLERGLVKAIAWVVLGMYGLVKWMMKLF